MSTEALKLITGVGETLSGKLWLYDALSASVRTLGFSPDPQRTKVTELGEYQPVACTVEKPVAQLEVTALQSMPQEQEVLLVDVREGWERDIVAIPGSIHLPLAKVRDEAVHTIPAEAPTIVMVCKTGVRSQQAVEIAAKVLPESCRLYSLAGGTLAWHLQVEGEKISY